MSVLPIVEVVAVVDIYSTDVPEIEIIGPCARVHFCAIGHSYGGTDELHPVVNIVMPIEALIDLTVRAQAALRTINVIAFPQH